MIAVAELSAEIESAYGVPTGTIALKEPRPGVPIEEIAIRMELNRIRKEN